MIFDLLPHTTFQLQPTRCKLSLFRRETMEFMSVRLSLTRIFTHQSNYLLFCFTGFNIDRCSIALCTFASYRSRSIYFGIRRASCRYGIIIKLSLYNRKGIFYFFHILQRKIVNFNSSSHRAQHRPSMCIGSEIVT